MRCFRILTPALLVALALAASEATAGLTEAERRGKVIYQTGRGRHPISAFLPSAGFSAPGSAFTCVGCHLATGAGQLEGGVQSSDITWFTLTKEFSGKRPSGRAHPPYDEDDLINAITDGVDPAGNELHTAHPHYDMHAEDLADLVAYVKMMDREPVPGISDTEVRIGMLLPSRGPLADAGREVQALLSGHFSELNARGGIFARSLVLVPLVFDPGTEGAATDAARAAVEAEEVFCFLANVGMGPEDGVARYLETQKVPVLVPLLSAPESGYAAGQYTFHVLASIRDQARVMTDFAASRLTPPTSPVAIVHAADATGRGGAEGVREQAEKHGLVLGPVVTFAPATFAAAEVVARLQDEQAAAVLYFGGAREAAALAEEAERVSWRPLLLAPAPLAGSALQAAPAGLLPSVFLAFPFQPPDPASPRMAEFASLGEKYQVGGKHRLFQLLALSGALLLEEGIKQAGKGVTRETLVAALEKTWQLETGLTPPLSYNPNQRSGTTGAAILGVDTASRRLVSAAPWQEPQ